MSTPAWTDELTHDERRRLAAETDLARLAVVIGKLNPAMTTKLTHCRGYHAWLTSERGK